MTSIKNQCRGLIDAEYDALYLTVKTANDLYQYLAGLYIVTEELAEELFIEMFPDWEDRGIEETPDLEYSVPLSMLTPSQ